MPTATTHSLRTIRVFVARRPMVVQPLSRTVRAMKPMKKTIAIDARIHARRRFAFFCSSVAMVPEPPLVSVRDGAGTGVGIDARRQRVQHARRAGIQPRR